MLADGMNIDSGIHIQVLTNKVSQAAVREAQLEAGVQTLLAERQELLDRIIKLETEQLDEIAEV